ncbi:putative ubiquitin carboxyl-terminal hydrolase 3 [Neolecta irregularis DAH-3]|uniref:Ubiquitin carboxyl-terminal hydrolase n=1 Tax=Neolecta irregularis (strain DAH-3) TaxID=1198029 RepID=A0A1U7LTU3_NEOID|nr:putative ubiquitin carboxyl-terminal hydrolase 3 [Neolecta irregularis DAH-3]|eukprot:OLL26064.1 putative ubiquitin carboxyl-terminal hydrolase 3 [Neolecta irregularis DAH-3]
MPVPVLPASPAPALPRASKDAKIRPRSTAVPDLPWFSANGDFPSRAKTRCKKSFNVTQSQLATLNLVQTITNTSNPASSPVLSKKAIVPDAKKTWSDIARPVKSNDVSGDSSATERLAKNTPMPLINGVSRKRSMATTTESAPVSSIPPSVIPSDVSVRSISTSIEKSSSPTTEPVSPALSSPLLLPSLSPTDDIPRPALKSWSDLVKSSIPIANKLQCTLRPPQSTSNLQNIATLKANGLGELLSSFDTMGLSSKAPFIQPRGLVNTGNMCFMNAILQVLIFCPPFYNLLHSVGTKVAHDFSKFSVYKYRILLLREFRVVNEKEEAEDFEEFGEPFVPQYVYDSMRGNKRFDSMQRGHQEDAEEFLGFLLDGLHEEFITAMQTLPCRPKPIDEALRQVSVPLRDSGASCGEYLRVESIEKEDGWLEVGPKQKTSVTRTATITESPITRIFGGKLRSVLKVPGLKDSITFEPYQPLQLDIQEHHITSINDALRHLTVLEDLEGEWKSSATATKQVFIETLPLVLILHLKRFLYDNVGGTQKSWKRVGYPLELEIPQEVISPNLRGQFSGRYKLFSVVYHHGKSASGGHYTVDLLEQDSRSWIHLDDTVIRKISADQVAVSAQEEERADLGDKLAYILFYQQMYQD